ncbi:MAG: hypothetical protein JSV62_09055 [Promethearchaeota archaeon]|nr:MAG: hypothetical protein JSV62_09055 [Candidatus Lokiarchaeota archaeon]
MELSVKLRIIAGILCLLIAVLRVVQFFFDLNGAFVYSAINIPWGEYVSFVEAIGGAIIGIVLTIGGTGLAFFAYLISGVVIIAGRKLTLITLGCNIISDISIILCIRAIYIYTIFGLFNILLTIFLIIYIAIFSICIVSYIKIRKEGSNLD